MDLIEVKFDLLFTSGPNVLLALREVDGNRVCVFNTDPLIVDYIIAAKRGDLERSITHDLLIKSILKTGYSFKKISIKESKNSTLIAKITINKDGSNIELDARPTDAFIIALRLGMPFLINSEYIAENTEYKTIKRNLLGSSERYTNLANMDHGEMKRWFEDIDEKDLPKA